MYGPIFYYNIKFNFDKSIYSLNDLRKKYLARFNSVFYDHLLNIIFDYPIITSNKIISDENLC